MEKLNALRRTGTDQIQAGHGQLISSTSLAESEVQGVSHLHSLPELSATGMNSAFFGRVNYFRLICVPVAIGRKTGCDSR